MSERLRQTSKPEGLSDFALRLRELLADLEQHPKGSWERELAEQKLAQAMKEHARS